MWGARALWWGSAPGWTPWTRSSVHNPTATPPLPRIPPKTTPNPKPASSYIYMGLAPAPFWLLLSGGGITVPRESPQGKARPFPQGYGVAVGTLVLTQCHRGWWGCPGSPRESPVLPLPAPGGHNGSGSRICLRAGFVLKRFIIFLTGRFPVSVLVNNCSQLNLCKIRIVGTGMRETQHARISHEPTGGSCCRRGAP